tara:strand:+ start:2582 stop:8218 length:5637 start_codon:yes stop_codon:yes gene_type:complete
MTTTAERVDRPGIADFVDFFTRQAHSVDTSNDRRHPSEEKRLSRIPPSKAINEITRHVAVILPAESWQSIRPGTSELLTGLQQYACFVVTECSYKRSSLLELRDFVLKCGVVVNGLDEVDAQLWHLYQDARVAGVLVMNYDLPGLYLAQDSHVEPTAAVPKQIPVHFSKLGQRCKLCDDGYREVIIHVISGSDMQSERQILRDKVLPILLERCRTKKVRPVLVDPRDRPTHRGMGTVLQSAQDAQQTGMNILLLSGDCGLDSPLDRNQLTNFIDTLPKGKMPDFDWVHSAPVDYTYHEYILAHILHLSGKPVWMFNAQGVGHAIIAPSRRPVGDDGDDGDRGDNQLATTANETQRVNCISEEPISVDYQAHEVPSMADTISKQYINDISSRQCPRLIARESPPFIQQHVLAYVRGENFACQVSGNDIKQFSGADPYEKERIGSLLSTMYAHPSVAIRPYLAKYEPSNDGNGLPKRISGHAINLNGFATEILEDIWSVIGHEFGYDVREHSIALREQQSEHSLAAAPPFFSRSVHEHSVLNCIKLGRPRIIFIEAMPGGGVSSILQQCARECTRNLTGVAADEIVVLSFFPRLSHTTFTPTQIFRHLALSLKEKCHLTTIEIPGTYNGARSAFLELLLGATDTHRRIVIIIDGVIEVDNPRGIAWLFQEEELPARVQIVIGGKQLTNISAQSLNKNGDLLAAGRDPIMHITYIQRVMNRTCLNMCVRDAMKHVLQLRPMQYSEQRRYLLKSLKSENISADEALITAILQKSEFASMPYARLLVECLGSLNCDSPDIFKHINELPNDLVGMVTKKLNDLETLFSVSILASVLPLVIFGCGTLTMEDIMAIIVAVLSKEEETYLNSMIVPTLMWEARHLITGPVNGTYRIASDMVENIVLNRYAPTKEARRLLHQNLADFYGYLESFTAVGPYPRESLKSNYGKHTRKIEEDGTGTIPSSGKALLFRMHQLSPRALERDADAQLIDHEAFQEHHMVIDAVLFLPYFLSQGRQFEQLCTLLSDFSFLQAKLELGEGAALLEDYDRVIQYPKSSWLDQVVNFTHNNQPEHHSSIKEAFKMWLERDIGSMSFYRNIVALRSLIVRNCTALHRRPHLILQVAMNSPGDPEHGQNAESAVREHSPPPEIDNSDTPSSVKTYDELLLLWENRPNEIPMRELHNHDVHSDAVTACAWLDNTSFVSGGKDGLVAIWSALTGECVFRLFGHDLAITSLLCVTIPSQGCRIISASRDCTIRVWKFEGDVGQTSQILRGHADQVLTMDFMSVTAQLFSAGCDRCICIWDISSIIVKMRHKICTTHAGPIASLKISPAGNMFVTGSSDCSLQVWLLGNGGHQELSFDKHSEVFVMGESKPELALTLQGHLEDVTCCSFILRDEILATGSLDRAIMLWNPITGQHVGALIGHTDAVTHLSHSSDGQLLISTSMDYELRIWRPFLGESIMVLNQGCACHVASLSPDGSALLVGADDCIVAVWGWVGRKGSMSLGQYPQEPGLFSRTPRTAQEMHVLDSPYHPFRCGVSRTGQNTAQPFHNKYQRAFDGQIHKRGVTAIVCIPMSGSSPAHPCRSVRDVKGLRLASTRKPRIFSVTGGEDCALRMIVLNNDRALYVSKSFEGHTEAVRSIATHPETGALVSASDDGNLMTWDTNTGVHTGRLTGHSGPVLTCCYAGRCDRILSGGKDRVISVWDTADNRTGLQVFGLKGHSGRITGLDCFRGTHSISGSSDRSIRSWDLTVGRAVQIINGHDGGVNSLSLIPVSSLILTTSLDHSARLWDARISTNRSQQVHKIGFRDLPVACASCETQPAWISVCAGDGLSVYDTRVWREIAFFRGLADLTCVTFHGESTLLCGDKTGQVYSLDVWKTPTRSWSK